MKNKQSSVEWLFEQVCNLDWKNLQVEKKLEILEQAKAMHKEEIENSFAKGCKIGVDVGSNWDYHEGYGAKEYYNETFEGGNK